MTIYRHRQVGTLVRSILIPVIVLNLFVAYLLRFHPLPLVVLVIMFGCLIGFHSLTVEVTDRLIRLRFGSGPIRMQFSLSTIRHARVVRNRWYYGWGIRWIPGGWLFNVSGLDAVELEMVGGRKYRIGTDEPMALLSAIENARGVER